MSLILKKLTEISTQPTEPAAFERWIEQSDVIPLLRQIPQSNEVVLYANLPSTFIHSIMIPLDAAERSNTEDLLTWNFHPYQSAWSVVSSSDNFWVESSLASEKSSGIARGEQLVYCRSFEGVAERKHYVELSQKFVHVMDIHNMPERNAWCQLNKHGDIENVVTVHEIPKKGSFEGGTIVTCNRQILADYAAYTQSALLVMFDFTRFKPSGFLGWGGDIERRELSDGDDIFYTLAVEPSYGSFSRGIQIVPIATPFEEAHKKLWGFGHKEPREYATFIVQDFKNDQNNAEVSTAPGATANYFTESDLPFETSPVFFRPEVLTKYKADREKYTIKNRSITCRGSWYLKIFDINEAGQVFTYLVYLRNLPYEEQLYWKSYNEEMKAPISDRAFNNDFNGEWHHEYDPLLSLHHRLEQLHSTDVSWWKLRNPDLLEITQYPVTTSMEEWSTEILNLDHLIGEGFEEKWLRKKAEELNQSPDPRERSLALVEKCLIGLGFESDHAREIASPLHEIRNLRNKLKGHPTGNTAKSIKSNVLKEFGTYTKHFKHLCTECDEALKIITTALRG